MYELRSMLYALIGLAALSEIVLMLCGGKNEGNGPELLCGLCCAGCILSAVGMIFGMLV